MSNDSDLGDLERPDDLRFQERVWRFQRITWAGLAWVILLALLGGFGDGLFSESTVGQPKGARLTYPRTSRAGSEVIFDVHAPIDARGEAKLHFLSHTEDRIDLLRVVPPPDRVIAGPDEMTYVYQAEPAGGLARVRLMVSPRGVGLFRGQVGFDDGTVLQFPMLILP